MKQIVGQKQVDDVRLFCDMCENEINNYENHLKSIHEHTFEGRFNFGYHSGRDGEIGEIDLCHFCAEKFYEFIKGFNANFKLINVLNQGE